MNIETKIADRNGYPTPILDIHAEKGTHFRAVRAKALRLAADLEEASLGERWVVTVESTSDSHSRVYLETVQGTEAEAKRGAELMRLIAGR